jgi:flagellar hook-basal body complex protein FliE
MTVPPIAPLDGVIEPDAMSASPEAGPAAPKFADWFFGELSAVNDKLVTADHDMQKLAVGAAGNLHEVMITWKKHACPFRCWRRRATSCLRLIRK